MVMDVGRFNDHVREAMLVGSVPPRLVRPSHVQVSAPMLGGNMVSRVLVCSLSMSVSLCGGARPSNS